jgi:hypothetical protein
VLTPSRMMFFYLCPFHEATYWALAVVTAGISLLFAHWCETQHISLSYPEFYLFWGLLLC